MSNYVGCECDKTEWRESIKGRNANVMGRLTSDSVAEEMRRAERCSTSGRGSRSIRWVPGLRKDDLETKEQVTLL